MASQKNKNREVEEELKLIYQDEAGQLPDMSSLDFKKSSPWKKAVVFSLLILALISGTAWAGFLLFNGPSKVTGRDVELSITAPFSASSGQTVTYKVEVKNNESTLIKDLQLKASLPYGFFLDSSNYEYQKDSSQPDRPSNVYTWQLPAVSAGSSLNVTLVGQLIGEKGQKPLLTMSLKFRPEEISSVFETSASFATEITDTILTVTADYKNQIIQSEPWEMNYTIKNISETEKLNEVTVALEIPESLKNPTLTWQSDPEKETLIALDEDQQKQFDEDKTFSLTELSPKQSVSFKLSGQFEVSENSTQTVAVKVSVTDAHGENIPQADESAEVQVIKGEMITDLIVNGSAADQTINFGESLQYLIHLKNKSKTALGDIKVRFVAGSPALDWSTLKDSQKGIVSGQQILWTAKEIKALEVLLPEGEVDINFSISAKPYSKLAELKPSTLPIAAYYDVEINKIESLETVKKIESPTITLSFNSNTELAASARYFDADGTAIGTGPLPPTVAQKTTYQISWKINNSLHELQELSLSAELPSNVIFENQVNAEAGELKNEGKMITWTVNRMPLSVKSLTATFFVSLTPQVADINKILTLLKEATLKATDKDTTGSISLTASPLTTDLAGDKTAEGKGLIQAQ